MRYAAALALYAALVGLATPGLLRRFRLAGVAPRLGVAAWLAAAVSVVAAIVLAAAVATFAAVPVRDFIGDLLRACVDVFHVQYSGSHVRAIVSLVILATILGWLAFAVVRTITQARRHRSFHRAALDLVGHRHPTLDITILDHPSGAAYCLPGAGGRIVVTSSLLDQLSPDELAAVVTHERAHLAGRHHLALITAQAAARAIPFGPLMRTVRDEVHFLLERAADEAATRSHPRTIVASALLRLANAPEPPGPSLAGGGTTALERADHLLSDAAPSSGSRFLARMTIAALTAIPILLVAANAVSVSVIDHCTV